MSRAARVFTIAPGVAFLPELVRALLDGRLIPGFAPGPHDPLALADVTILVPTRRATRVLREAFAAALGGQGVLLPSIRPLGDVDEDELHLSELAGGDLDPLDIPPALSETERHLILTRLVLAWRQTTERLRVGARDEPLAVPASAADAAWMARDLMGLIDQAATEEIDFSGLSAIVADRYADYWQLSLEFLRIVTELWPAILAERGALDPFLRRRLLIDRERQRLEANPPAGPVIAAGSTGSIPATARLLRTISRLERGAVVLPGLDLDLDEATFQGLLGDTQAPPIESHPQYGLARLLHSLEISRADVMSLGAPPVALAARTRLANDALRPAGETGAWATLARTADHADALAGVTLLTAAHEREEAQAIAVALRETVETPGATAALVTPDRALARRVALELTRFGLEVDDSAGRPLATSPAGTFARLVATVLADPTDVASLLALLKHRHARFGLSVEALSEAVSVIEIAGLRGRRLVGGLAGLPAALRATHTAVHRETARERPHIALKRLSAAAWHAGIALALRLADLFGGGDPITDLAGAHARHLATVRQAASDAAGSDRHLFSGDDGEALAALMIGLSDALMAPHANLTLAGRDHAALFEAVVAGASVRRKRHDEPRVFIWGPLEARLQTVDRLVLGGLNEGTWPATTRADPWLSRPMRADLKLASPERRIGLAAHDFAQAVSSGEVILARASRVGGAPTVASRWWQRLTALMGPDAARGPTERGARLIALSKYLDPIPAREVLRRPAPQVEPADRLTRISASRVETWIRDPFALLAERILRLEPMPELEATLDAADRGTLIHAVMAAFARDGAGLTGPAALAAFERHAEAALADIADQPDIVALWRPRLKAIAPFAIETEANLADVVERYVEIGGGIEFEVAGAPFKLTAYADRVDLLADGRIALIDHKTGTPPSDKVVNVGLSPQLALEAAIAVRGGFDTLGPREVARMAYWHLSGGATGGKVEARAKTPDTAPAVLAAAAFDNLCRLVELDRAVGRYPSRPRVQFEKRLDGPYDHLARVAEWAAGETADPEGGE